MSKASEATSAFKEIDIGKRFEESFSSAFSIEAPRRAPNPEAVRGDRISGAIRKLSES